MEGVIFQGGSELFETAMNNGSIAVLECGKQTEFVIQLRLRTDSLDEFEVIVVGFRCVEIRFAQIEAIGTHIHGIRFILWRNNGNM